MQLVTSAEYEYIPAAGGNAKADEPAVFVCKYLTPAQSDDAIKYHIESQGSTQITKTTINNDKLIRSSVKEIRNLDVDGEKIRTVAEFLRVEHPVADAMYKELCAEIMTRNRVDGEKLKN